MAATFSIKKVAKSSAERKVIDGGGGGVRRFLKVENSLQLSGILNLFLIEYLFNKCKCEENAETVEIDKMSVVAETKNKLLKSINSNTTVLEFNQNFTSR